MADFKLSEGKVERTSGSGGISPGQGLIAPGSFSVQAGYIDPNAANVSVGQTPNIPNVNFKAYDAAVNFSNTLIKVGLALDDRKSDLKSSRALSAYKDIVGQMYNGSTDENGEYKAGYAGMTGVEAVDSYDAFSAGTEEAIKALTQDMEPRVKQKFLVGAYAERTRLLNKAATHRNTQHKLAEIDTAYRDQQNIAREIVIDPNNINRVNAVSGTTAKDDFLISCNKHDSQETCSERLKDMLVDGIYLQAANAYNAVYASTGSKAQAIEAQESLYASTSASLNDEIGRAHV